MHAAGHAFLAAAAGVLARALARGSSPMDGGSRSLLRSVGAPESPEDAALALAVFGVLAAIVKLVGGALASWAEARVAGEVGAGVRLAVLDQILALDRLHTPRQHDHGSPGSGPPSLGSASLAESDGGNAHGSRDVDHPGPSGAHADRLTALTSHVAEVERGVAQGVLSELRAIVQLVPLGVLLVALAPKLAGSAVIALGGFGLLAFALRRAFKRAHARAAASAGALVEAADEAVRHAELWATYGARRRIRSHVAAVGRAIAHEAARIRVRASLLSSTSEVLGAIALVLALLLAARGALGVDHGTVVPFAIAFFMAYRPLRDLVDARLARSRGEAALRSALGAAVAGARDTTEASSMLRTSWTLDPLTLSGVRSRHGGHRPVSVEIPAGSIAAVVGPTGIGKTSLLRALLGLDPLAEGEIRYGTLVLDRAAVGPSERPFAWVPQDAPVVGDTLAINVGLGRADDDAPVPDPRPVLAELGNEGLATSLGDQVLGTVRPLSGGERQWIAVARALATGLPVLLLDEPTSALDAASQARLLEGIARLRGKRTILVVTHRPEPLAIADVVVRLDAISTREDVSGSTRPAPSRPAPAAPPPPTRSPSSAHR